MSAGIPTPFPDKRRSRPSFLNTNSKQVILFAVLTLLLSLASVWGGRIWLRNSETLTFAVGEANAPEARFAVKLAAMLKASSSRLHLRIIPHIDNAKAIAQFDHKLADLAVLRTDGKIPPRARSLAILEHDLLILVSPGAKKIKSLAELKKKKITLLTRGNNLAFVRNVLEIPANADAGARLQLAPPNSTIESLFASGGYGAVIATAILDIGERVADVQTVEALDALQDEFESVLRRAVIGLRDGTISSDGLDTFKLGYEFVRDEIGMRRESLKRQSGHDDNVVVVKTVQSA